MSVRRQPGPASLTIDAALEGLDGYVGKTGYFETAVYPDGTPVAYVATIQEFGYPSGGIPARPTMRPTAEAQKSAWRDLLRAGAKAALNGQISPRDVLEAVALRAAGDVGKSIQALTSPPLHPDTIKAKGFAKPLVDTGQMFQSVTGVVEARGAGGGE